MAAIAIGVFFIFKGEMTVPLLFAGIQIIGNIMNPIASLFQRYAWIVSTKPIMDKHSKLVSSTSKEYKIGENIDGIKDINIQNLNFSFGERKIINDLSFCFEKGKKYVILGESGSGKSTFLKLLMGYFEDYSGKILYSNKDLKNINYSSLYNQISVLHQNLFLFEDTLENNIKLYKPVDNFLYDKAIDMANLRQVKERLKKNDSLIRDNGTNLSGGEKQRIAIARCLVNQTELLFIDEATANLDPENSRIFYNIITKLPNTTCIAITHERDRDILNCFDEILLLENGKLNRAELEKMAF
ncbi:MAG: ABC transporter ATP-binding protein [Tissierellia bacterium]|nr:ABC transporter ATP-binding protein [Tissierellia bacterium]